jgi:hypothetical protein
MRRTRRTHCLILPREAGEGDHAEHGGGGFLNIANEEANNAGRASAPSTAQRKSGLPDLRIINAHPGQAPDAWAVPLPRTACVEDECICDSPATWGREINRLRCKHWSV